MRVDWERIGLAGMGFGVLCLVLPAAGRAQAGSTAAAPLHVSVTPAIIAVETGEVLRLTATVENDKSGKGVSWSYSNPACTTSENEDYIVQTTSTDCGVLSEASRSSVVFRAPQTAPNPATVTVTATSLADPTQSSSAQVVISSGWPAVWIFPSGATVPMGQTRRFQALTSDDHGEGVIWEVNSIPGGNSQVGTVNENGVYRAPTALPQGGTVQLSAVLRADRSAQSTAVVAVSTNALVPLPLHGVTVADWDFNGNFTDIRDAGYLSQTKGSLNRFAVTPTARITFTLESGSTGGVGPGGSEGPAASSYLPAFRSLKSGSRQAWLMGEVLDSSYVGCFTLADHNARWKQYVNTLAPWVDIWEVGNEINGNWLDSEDSEQSCDWTVPDTSDATVIQKMKDAYAIVRAHGGLTELTIYYPGQESLCGNGSPDPFEPIVWSKENVPAAMRNGLDYVLISYYHTDCPDGIDPTPATWGHFFTQLQNVFPNAKIGFGEWGFSGGQPTDAQKTAVIHQGYSLAPLGIPFSDNWASGVFYWEFDSDGIPYTVPLWKVFNAALQAQP